MNQLSSSHSPDPADGWKRYREHLCECRPVGMALDISRMGFDADFFARMAEPMARAFEAMNQLEAGAIANPDEQRMVGHYWLRAPHLAPTAQVRQEIEQTIANVEAFAAQVHGRAIKPPLAARFTDVLTIGIGGSALGPQLAADALAARRDKLRPHFADNTDPDGIDRLLAALGPRLKSTLVVVISKSGSTKETRNGMLEVEAAFARKDLPFARQAVAVTGEGSQLDKHARSQGWLAGFPMWDFVGGRTSITSAVGLLPMALQGANIRDFLRGAADMDALTRAADVKTNPAARLALMWHWATGGRGERQMVVLPYKDRLLLLSRYLQQLVMESLGKAHDLDGRPVRQGLTVFGNKGSTDQHAYVQQLRDGLDDFFVNFIVVRQERAPADAKRQIEVEPGVTTGDYLHGFYLGTRQALSESGRPSLTLTLDRLDARRLGALLALYERAVGYYASLIRVNAYHQPGVEAGKKAAAAVLELQGRAVAYLRQFGQPADADAIAAGLGQPDAAETVQHVLEHLAANKRFGLRQSGRRFAVR
jgi:glucose-6-phosphate isomerase